MAATRRVSGGGWEPGAALPCRQQPSCDGNLIGPTAAQRQGAWQRGGRRGAAARPARGPQRCSRQLDSRTWMQKGPRQRAAGCRARARVARRRPARWGQPIEGWAPATIAGTRDDSGGVSGRAGNGRIWGARRACGARVSLPLPCAPWRHSAACPRTQQPPSTLSGTPSLPRPPATLAASRHLAAQRSPGAPRSQH